MSWEKTSAKAAEIATQMARSIQELIESDIISPDAKWKIYPHQDGVDAFLESYGDTPIHFTWDQFYKGIEASTTMDDISNTIEKMKEVIAKLQQKTGGVQS